MSIFHGDGAKLKPAPASAINTNPGVRNASLTVRGPYVLVIRPNGFVAPSTWKSLDSRNSAFTR